MVAGRRVRLAVLAAGAATVLAGCGLTPPGAAAVVGSERISKDQVDDLTASICSAQLAANEAQAAQTQRIPSRSLREGALGILVENELAAQFGEAKDVEPDKQQVSQIVSQSEANLSVLPEDEREAFRSAVRENAEGQSMLVQIGQESLGSTAGENEAFQEGYRLMQEWSADVDVEVDPRYGGFENGMFQPGAGTPLSVAASERAKAGAEQQLAEGFVATLPASQQCG